MPDSCCWSMASSRKALRLLSWSICPLNATETTKAASECAREVTQIGVRKATEGFEQISKAAQTATEELNSQMTQAREGATKAGLKFLEVAKDNAPALALYERFGFAKVGERSGYYRRADGTRATAIVMRKALG